MIGNGSVVTLRARNRCDGAAHGPCCLATCTDERPGGAKVDVDCGGPCARAEAVILCAVNADLLPTLGDRFFVDSRGAGAGSVPVLLEGVRFFGHTRWFEFS
ncbi:MAG: hypothetical protein ACJAYU_000410 [Bradymonadia bacterium]|jgi:hypothetical protein